MPSWWWSRTNKRKNEPSNHRPPPPHPVNTPTTSTTTPPPSRSPGLHRLPGDREERGRAASTRRRRGGARFAPPRDAAAGRRAPWLCRSKASRSRGPSRGQLRLGSFLRADTAPCRGLRVGVGRELAGVRRCGGGRPQNEDQAVYPGAREVNLQSFGASTGSTPSRGRMLHEETRGARTTSLSPGPRGHALASSYASPGDLGFGPCSTVKRVDDLKSRSQPLPLPLAPITIGESGKLCAIKEVQVVLDDPKSKERLPQLNQEIDMLRQLSHQNIVQYYGSELIDETLSIYFEYVSGGSIYNLLRDYGPFTEPVICNYIRQILRGLAYLHGRKTLHRDIKGANTLVCPNGEVKLADFGVAKHISSLAEIRSFRGSPYWMAPGVPAMFKIAYSEDVPDIPESFSKEGKDFLRLCLKRDPAQRPSATQLLGHPFLQDHQGTRVTNCNNISPLRNGPSFTAEAWQQKMLDLYLVTVQKRVFISKEKHCSSSGHQRTERARFYRVFHCSSFIRQSLQHPNQREKSTRLSPCSSPLRQLKQSNWSCLPSPSHPAFSSSGSTAYNPVSNTQNQKTMRNTTAHDPWHDIGHRPQSSYGSPKRF